MFCYLPIYLAFFFSKCICFTKGQKKFHFITKTIDLCSFGINNGFSKNFGTNEIYLVLNKA